MPSRNLLSSVVVPTDFSEGAQHALDRALRLPLGPKSKLTLLHVLPDDIPGKLRKEAIAEAERSLEKTAARASQEILRAGMKVQVVSDVVEGVASEQILKRAHTVEADVICMGRHGRRSLTQVLLGSVSSKVVRVSDLPVLVVKSHGLQPGGAASKAGLNPYRRVVAAIDLLKGSDRVLKAMKPYVEGVVDLSVLHASTIPYEDFVLLDSSRVEELRVEALNQATKDLRSLVTKAGLVRAEPKVAAGDARLLILEEAKAHTAELIVVGTRGVKGLKRVVVGSVAEWVLANASCDVLVARA
ncbi:MAG: universal stress protein [Archangium sp.]|nr:universal stress protein [Archangium sp.]